ncbi:MAG: transposase [Rhodanobacter sp.]
MRKSKYGESQITEILQEPEAGPAVAEVARKHGIIVATFYRWLSKCGGMSVSDMQWRHKLEQENTRHQRAVDRRQQKATGNRAFLLS